MNESMNQARQQQIEEMKRGLLNKILAKEAYERLSRVRMVNPSLAGEAEIYLLNIYQSGKLSGPLSDDSLKKVLRILDEKRDFKIKRM